MLQVPAQSADFKADPHLREGGVQTKRIDLVGRVVIPGINDAHYHCDVEPNAFHLQFNSEDPTWREVADQLAAAETKAQEY